tara:strand:- start:226 stop:435 length:210 start_codon:yes stop_codon:yes gene_type:complete
MVEEDISENLSEESLVLEEDKFDVIYECIRCKVKVGLAELNRLPEIKCICGFRVFIKIRPPIVKTIKAV